MNGKVHLEALAFAAAWAALAFLAWSEIAWEAGVAMLAALFLVVMPSSALILSRTGDFAKERTVRWSILILAAALLIVLI